MMLYTFIKDANSNVVRIGADCDVPEALQAVMRPYSESGYVLAAAEEYDAQILASLTHQAEELKQGMVNETVSGEAPVVPTAE